MATFLLFDLNDLNIVKISLSLSQVKVSVDFSARFYRMPTKKARQIAKIPVYADAKFHGNRLNTFGMATFLLFYFRVKFVVLELNSLLSS